MPIFFPSAVPILPASAIIDTEDFDNPTIGSTATDRNLWLRSNTGTSAAPTTPTVVDAGRFGIRQLATGTTATGRCALSKGLLQWYFPSTLWLWQCAIRSVSLSLAAQAFIIRAGLSDTDTGDFVNGIYFEYDQAVSVNWQFCKAVAGVRTKLDTRVAVVANQWVKFKAYGVGAAQAIFKVDNITVGVHTDLPLTALGRVYQITKSFGTGSRLLHIDYDSLGYVSPVDRG